MKVLRKHRTRFDTAEFRNVTKIQYSSGNNEYTLTYGENQTSTFSAETYMIFIINE